MDCTHSQDLTRRLARVGGQINGIKEMVNDGRDCVDILVQLSSVNSALHQVERLLVEEHLEHCVKRGAGTDNGETTMNELKKILEQYAKMK